MLEVLMEALNNKSVVVVAGAGISIDAPSNLPSWREYNQLLLEGVNKLASELTAEQDHLIDVPQIMSTIPLVTISDILVHYAAGNSYFPLLKLLNGSQPNKNHFSLAELADKKMIKAIVTTNFDTLIEQAFDNKSIPYLSLTSDSQFENLPEETACAVAKIHGCVTDTDSLVDTVTQKMKGLTENKRKFLRNLFTENHIVVIGFSGSDLSFDIDYLPLSYAKKGVTWISKPGRSLNDNVKVLQQNIDNFNLIDIELNRFFPDIGVVDLSKQECVKHKCSDFKAKAIDTIYQFLQEGHIAKWGCYGLCIHLLKDLGQFDKAIELCNYIQPIVKRKPVLSGLDDILEIFAQIALLDSIGMMYLQNREFQKSIINISLAFDYLVSFNRFANENLPESQSRRDEFCNNSSTVLNNLGLAYWKSGNRDMAIKSFGMAHAYALQLLGTKYEYTLPTISMNSIEMEYENDNNYDKYIIALNRNANTARKAGNSQTLFEIYTNLINTYFLIGEYPLAEKHINELELLLRITYTLHNHVIFHSLNAELQVRRGAIDKARSIYKTLINFADIHNNEFFSVLSRYYAIHNLLLFEITNDFVKECISYVKFSKLKPSDFYGLLPEIEEIETLINNNTFPNIPTYLISIANKIRLLGDFAQLRIKIMTDEFNQDYSALLENYELLYDKYADNNTRQIDISYCRYKISAHLSDKKKKYLLIIQYGLDLMNSGNLSEAKIIFDEIIASVDVPNKIKGLAYSQHAIISYFFDNNIIQMHDYYKKGIELLSGNGDTKHLCDAINNYIRTVNTYDKEEAQRILAEYQIMFKDNKDVFNVITIDEST